MCRPKHHQNYKYRKLQLEDCSTFSTENKIVSSEKFNSKTVSTIFLRKENLHTCVLSLGVDTQAQILLINFVTSVDHYLE